MYGLSVALLEEDAKLAEIVQRLVVAYHPERIYLFGSKARGQAGPDSDYDLMVIVSEDAAPEQRTSRLAYQALRGTGTAADVLVWTWQAFNERLHLRASLPSTIIREGKLLCSG
ncbi:MAG: nucleotidyltransferase domain-containing protein [Anaerolineae bacterium]